MIERISLNNFKSIKHIDFEIHNFSIVVGNNGAGKTNLLKAINLISLLSQGKQIDTALAALQLLPSELLFDSSNNKIGFIIELNVRGRHVKYAFEIIQEFDGAKYTHRVASELLKNGNQDLPILQRAGEKINISPEEGAVSSAIDLTDNQLALSSLTKPLIISETKKILSKIVVDTFEPIRLRQVGLISKVGSEYDLNLAEKLYGLVHRRPTSFNNIEDEAKEIISGLNAITVGSVNEDGNLYVKFKELGMTQEMTFFSASDGNLRSLGILSAILGEPQPSLLLIDEIENSLHPKRIRALVKLLNFISDKENNSIQVVVTTHSPVVLNCVSHPQIRYVYKHGKETKVSSPSKEKAVLKYLERGSEAGVELGDLFEEGELETIYTNPDSNEN